MVAEAGERPTLTFVRCHLEARRLELIVQTVQAEYERFSMVAVVRVAAALAKDGAIPDAAGPRARKSDFLKRCAAALGVLDASAECDVTKLPDKDQNAIRSILSGDGEPHDGCLGPDCVDQKTTWVTPKECVRCSRCGTPKSFGRLWTNGREMLRAEPIRLQQSIEMSEARTRSESKKRTRSALKSWTSED